MNEHNLQNKLFGIASFGAKFWIFLFRFDERLRMSVFLGEWNDSQSITKYNNSQFTHKHNFFSLLLMKKIVNPKLFVRSQSKHSKFVKLYNVHHFV